MTPDANWTPYEAECPRCHTIIGVAVLATENPRKTLKAPTSNRCIHFHSVTAWDKPAGVDVMVTFDACRTDVQALPVSDRKEEEQANAR
jgi:hypothetical protein